MQLRIALALAAFAVIVSPAALAQDAPQWDKVVAKAKAEGKVTFYSGLVGSPSTAAVARAFEKSTGIATEPSRSRAT